MKLRFKPRLSAPGYMIAGIALLSAGLLLFKLVALVPGLSSAETILPSVRASLSLLWNQPLDMPIILSRAVVAAISPTTSIGYSRLPNVILALLLVGCMYWLLRRWYNYRLALYGTLLLITAPWLLHVGRVATVTIVYPLSMALLLVLIALWHQQKRSKWLLYGSAVAVAMLLYVPGIVWLLVWAAIFERRNIITSLRNGRWHSAAAILLWLILLVPLGHMLTENWRLYQTVLGLPSHWPSVLHIGEQFLLTWKYLFVGGYHSPIYNLATLAIVNFLVTIGFVIGLYLYSKHLKAVRTRQLAGFWLIGTLLIAFQGPVPIQLLMPLVLVLAVGGLGYLLHLWLKVFPRNPLARGFGIGIMALMIAFAVAYNVRNYYVAWPNSAATKAVFKQQL
jgi:hypothetical protein